MRLEIAMPARMRSGQSTKLARLIAAVLWLICTVPGHAQTPVATTAYGYDETGNKTSQVDALGRTTSWTFDGKDRVTGRTLPDGTKESYSYDVADNVLAKTTFAGEIFSYQYSTNDDLTGQVIPAGTSTNSAIGGGSVVTGYTPTGNVTSRREQGPTTLGGVQSFKYNANDHLIEAKNPIGQISYSLDPIGSVLDRSIPGLGTVKYEYEEAGRLTKAIAADGKATLYSYDQAGRQARIDRELNAAGGQARLLTTSIVYDSADRPISYSSVKREGASFTFIVGQTLTRGPGGAISKIETDRGDGTSSTTGALTAKVEAVQSFEYDGLARLTRETRSIAGGTTDTRFEYDAVGNRTKKTATSALGTEITTYTYDIADRLTQESISLMAGGSRVVSYTYDGNGNLASKTEPGKVTLYRFDPRNKLIDIRVGSSLAEAQASASKARYAYDAGGNRVRKWTGEETGHLVDGNAVFPQVALQITPTGSVGYVRGLSLIRQVSRTGTAATDLFPLHGHLGSSLGALNADGDLIEQVDADAFGNFDQPTGLKQAHLHAGEYWDQDSQLLYLRARWYDPRIGRFISADPFEGRQDNPRSLNRYTYAHSDPVHNVDPTGEETLVGQQTAMANYGRGSSAAGINTTRQFAGSAANHVGKAFENKIFEAIKSCLRPGARIRRIDRKMPASDGRHAMPDFLLSIADVYKILEVKTKFPTSKIPQALERAARQLDAAIRAKYDVGMLSRTRHRDSTFSRRKEQIEQMLGGNAGMATYLNGTTAVISFVAEFVFEECLSNALGK